MPKIRSLKTCTLFEGLSYRDLAFLAAHIEEDSVEANAWLAEEGQESQGLVVVQSGRVRLFFKDQPESSYEIGPGEFFGELSLTNGGRPRAVAAQAVEPCTFLRLRPAGYKTLQQEAPDAAIKVAGGVMASVAERLNAAKGLLS